jgi:hypothetical protein
MPFHSIILVTHVIAVFVLCGALSIETLCLVRLRNASTHIEAATWITPVSRLSLFALVAVLTILFTGVQLVMRTAIAQWWPKLAAAALLLMGPLGAVTGRRIRAIRKAIEMKDSDSDLMDKLRDPFLKVSLGVRISMFFGIFLLVSAKPGLRGSLSLLAGAVLFGFILSLRGWGRKETRLATRV